MNLPAWIARRYFFSRKKRSFISWLSLLSMLGVGVGTMALIVVLSVFNGMEELNRQIFQNFEADMTIRPQEGKRFVVSAKLLTKLRQTPNVMLVSAVAQDNALARYNAGQAVIRLKGVDDNYTQRSSIDSAVTGGRFLLRQDSVNYAVVSNGIRNDLSISTVDILTPLEILYPQRNQSISVLNSEAFNSDALTVAGVFFIEANNYNNLVFAPISVVRSLLGYASGEATSLELQLTPGANEDQAKQALMAAVSSVGGEPKLTVQSRDDLNRDLYRAIRVEKLFVAIILVFIILVASVNIFFSLSMLVIEKREDIRILYAMGTTASTVRRIFLTEGAIIALTGAITGLVLGIGICLVQQQYGLISMGTSSSIVDAYPVRLDTSDVLLTSVLVVLMTILTSWFPAQRAARLVT